MKKLGILSYKKCPKSIKQRKIINYWHPKNQDSWFTEIANMGKIEHNSKGKQLQKGRLLCYTVLSQIENTEKCIHSLISEYHRLVLCGRIW